MVSVPEAARRAGRARGTIRRWIRAGTLPATAAVEPGSHGQDDVACYYTENAGESQC